MAKKKGKVVSVSHLKKYLKELQQREKLLENTIKHVRRTLARNVKDAVGTGLLMDEIMSIEELHGQINEIGKHILIIDAMIEGAAEDR